MASHVFFSQPFTTEFILHIFLVHINSRNVSGERIDTSSWTIVNERSFCHCFHSMTKQIFNLSLPLTAMVKKNLFHLKRLGKLCIISRMSYISAAFCNDHERHFLTDTWLIQKMSRFIIQNRNSCYRQHNKNSLA